VPEFPDLDDPHIVYLDVLTNSYYLNDLHEVGAYQLARDRLRTLALGQDDSQSMIAVLRVEESNHDHPPSRAGLRVWRASSYAATQVIVSKLPT
jgi:hypothetical protein